MILNRLCFVLSFVLVIAGMVVLTTSCSPEPSTEEKVRLAKAMVPTDPELNAIYQSSCRNCHSVAETGAPLTGDADAWQELLDDFGQDLLLQNVINGKAGMPPLGLCMECGEEEFLALIRFMASDK